jgi:hypothetical protein
MMTEQEIIKEWEKIIAWEKQSIWADEALQKVRAMNLFGYDRPKEFYDREEINRWTN